MKAISVRQPWAWAIAHGGKNVENRGWATSYRGLLAIHASRQWADVAAVDQTLAHAAGYDVSAWQQWAAGPPTGAIAAVADLIDCHRAERCCQPWGEETHSGKPARHLVLDNVRPLPSPVPCRGRLGIWEPPPRLSRDLAAQAAASKTHRSRSGGGVG